MKADDGDKPKGEAWEAYSTTVRRTYEFARSGAPTLFMWFEWCAILALLRYASIKTALWPLTAIQWIAAFALWGYFMSLAGTPQATWDNEKKGRSRRMAISMLVSVAATAGLMFSAFWLAGVLMTNPL